MLDYTIPNEAKKEETRDNFSRLYEYTEGEVQTFKEKWKEEESRLKSADICGFNEENTAKEVVRLDSGLAEEQEDDLRESAKKYRIQQKNKLEKEGEKQGENLTTIQVYPNMVKVKINIKGEKMGGGERKECKGFSVNSRRRLIQKMAMWNLNGYYLYFVTLTYPGLYARDWKIWKRDLEVFIKRIGRKYPEIAGCCWRIEFQKRGAPHFHLIIASKVKAKNLVLLRGQIAKMWADVVRDGYGKWVRETGQNLGDYEVEYQKHLKAGTGVEEVQGFKQLMGYVSKYLGKVEQANAIAEYGRNWGFRDINGEMDFSPTEEINMDYKEAVNLKRFLRRWLKSRGKIKYANILTKRVSYSVLGLGSDSSDNRAIYRVLSGCKRGLFTAHILPCTDDRGLLAGRASPTELRFIDRVSLGLVAVQRKAVAVGNRVLTPKGLGVVSGMYQCPILKRLRYAVTLDAMQADRSHFGAFELWQVRECVVTQSALF